MNNKLTANDVIERANMIQPRGEHEKLVVSKRQSYGRTLYDPENRVAHYFLRLQGGKTLTRDTLEIAFKLGFYPEIKQEEITFE